MKIEARIEQVPAGMMMVPLICGAILTTLTPHIGSFTNAFLVSASVLVTVDKLIGGNRTAGIAAATTAGNAVAVPLLVAAANTQYAAAAKTATILVTSSAIVTSLMAPPLTAWWHARVQRSHLVAREGI